jgi:hypothetical protein
LLLLRLLLLSTVVDLPPPVPDGGRSADMSSACRDGGSTTVWPFTSTLVDLPPLW